MNDSTPRVAIVTGAGRGIGAAVAQRLAQDGLRVAVLDRDLPSAEKVAAAIVEAGGQAAAVESDVTTSESVTQAVAQVDDVLGPPAVLVNNAGLIRDNLFFKMPLEDWTAVMDVHLNGSFLMTSAVQPHMSAARWGRIVNISSTSALGNRGQANYAAAKAGLQGFTKTLAIELGRFNITANAVAPGFIATGMTAATAQRMGMSFEDFKQSASAEIPVGRVGEPEDVAHTISFLVSEGAGFVSGQVIYVAGGPRV
jgi:3-oxoacyl-[acyl-carrier protein] reductase